MSTAWMSEAEAHQLQGVLQAQLEVRREGQLEDPRLEGVQRQQDAQRRVDQVSLVMW